MATANTHERKKVPKCVRKHAITATKNTTTYQAMKQDAHTAETTKMNDNLEMKLCLWYKQATTPKENMPKNKSKICKERCNGYGQVDMTIRCPVYNELYHRGLLK